MLRSRAGSIMHAIHNCTYIYTFVVIGTIYLAVYSFHLCGKIIAGRYTNAAQLFTSLFQAAGVLWNFQSLHIT